MRKFPRYLLWCDLETEGTDPKEHQILEVFLALSKFENPHQYTPLYHCVLNTTQARIDAMDPFVREMHTKSGLLEECLKSTKDIWDLNTELGAFREQLTALEDEEQVPLAGSTVSFDHGFLAQYTPHFNQVLSYRHFDVSSIKIECHQLGMRRIPKGEAHRAAEDIAESVKHLGICQRWREQYYLARARGVFVCASPTCLTPMIASARARSDLCATCYVNSIP